jgi:hypothetical protein
VRRLPSVAGGPRQPRQRWLFRWVKTKRARQSRPKSARNSNAPSGPMPPHARSAPRREGNADRQRPRSRSPPRRTSTSLPGSIVSPPRNQGRTFGRFVEPDVRSSTPSDRGDVELRLVGCGVRAGRRVVAVGEPFGLAARPAPCTRRTGNVTADAARTGATRVAASPRLPIEQRPHTAVRAVLARRAVTTVAGLLLRKLVPSASAGVPHPDAITAELASKHGPTAVVFAFPISTPSDAPRLVREPSHEWVPVLPTRAEAERPPTTDS